MLEQQNTFRVTLHDLVHELSPAGRGRLGVEVVGQQPRGQVTLIVGHELATVQVQHPVGEYDHLRRHVVHG